MILIEQSLRFNMIVKLLSYCKKWRIYDVIKTIRNKNEKLRKWPFCYIELAKSDRHHMFISTSNVTFKF